MQSPTDAGIGAQFGRRDPDLVELPLSALQQRIWFLCTSYSGDASPIIYVALRIRGPLVVDAWLRAVRAVVDRHESLRTRFVGTVEDPAQVVTPTSDVEVELLDVSDAPEPERPQRARELIAARKNVLLDMTKDRLVGSCLVRLADDDHVWCLTMHHIISDATSIDIIEHEMRAFYLAFVTGTEPAVPELPVQYGDFAVWQQTEAARAEQEEDLLFWREQLAGVPPLELPTDAPRPAEKGTRGAEVRRRVDPELAQRLEQLAETERCTPFMAVLTVLEALLGSCSGQDDFCIGTPLAGRTQLAVERLVGLFANTVAIRADLSGDPTFRELLARTRGTAIDALDCQDVPFGRIVAELDLPADRSRTQVFQVIFVMRTQFDIQQVELSGLTIEPFHLGSPPIIHDLVVDAWRGPTGLYLLFRYDSALFEQGTAEAMARRFERLLRAAVDNPQARLSELATLSEAEEPAARSEAEEPAAVSQGNAH